MKFTKILSLVAVLAAFAVTTISMPVHAEGDSPAPKKHKKNKKGKKSKKGKKEAAPAADAPAAEPAPAN